MNSNHTKYQVLPPIGKSFVKAQMPNVVPKPLVQSKFVPQNSMTNFVKPASNTVTSSFSQVLVTQDEGEASKIIPKAFQEMTNDNKTVVVNPAKEIKTNPTVKDSTNSECSNDLPEKSDVAEVDQTKDSGIGNSPESFMQSPSMSDSQDLFSAEEPAKPKMIPKDYNKALKGLGEMIQAQMLKDDKWSEFKKNRTKLRFTDYDAFCTEFSKMYPQEARLTNW